jgi:Asp-tRNA(Asn)/Glu-tRNA(Gln) amidotransferase A subunit family amidase
MATTLADARRVWIVADRYDRLDPYAKIPASLTTWHIDFRGPKVGGFTFAIPPPAVLEACSEPYQKLFTQAVDVLQTMGGTVKEIDYKPFEDAADLLYAASFVYERIASIGSDFLQDNRENLHPTTKALFTSAFEKKIDPWDVFNDLNSQAVLRLQAQDVFSPAGGNVDVLVVPTTPFHPTIAEMQADPLALNYQCGFFTHAANVMDLCAVSVNAGWYEVDSKRLPFGVMFLGGMGFDAKVLDIAGLLEDSVKGEK